MSHMRQATKYRKGNRCHRCVNKYRNFILEPSYAELKNFIILPLHWHYHTRSYPIILEITKLNKSLILLQQTHSELNITNES